MNKSVLNILGSHPSDAIALDNGHSQISYGTLINKVNQLADELNEHALESLALYSDNGFEWVIVDLACQVANILIVPIPLFFSQEQVQNLLSKSGSLSGIITDRSWEARKLVHVTGEVSLKSVNLQLLHCETSLTTPLPDATAKITFTSGSSGDPKGVCLSYKNQWLTAHSIADTLGFDGVTHLSLLPLTTLLENIAGIYAPLIRGGRILLPSMAETGLIGSSKVDGQKLLNCITNYQPSTLILVPELLLLLVTAADMGWQVPESLRFIAVGGAKVSDELLKKAHQHGLPVYQGYGLSECVSVVSLNTPSHHSLDSCGKPLPHCQISIDDGELVVEGNPSLGYAGDPDSWRQKRIHTGDTGFIDAQGYVHIQGRIKNTLVSSFGRNINPEWPESKLLAHAGIQHAVVFGDDKPYCTALIHPRFPELTQSDIQAVVDKCNSQLPDYAKIKHWHRLDYPLSVECGTLTENGRPKRQSIFSMYEDLLESTYHSLSEVATA